MVVMPGQNQKMLKVAEPVAENSEQNRASALRRQRLLPGLLAGAIALIIGTGLWAMVSIFAGHAMGWLALAVGLLVGLSIQFFGRGMEPIFGWMGAALVLLGCAIGNVLAVCGLASQAENIPLLSLCASITPALALKLTQQSFNVIDLIFYALAIYSGYRFSFRRQHHCVTKG